MALPSFIHAVIIIRSCSVTHPSCAPQSPGVLTWLHEWLVNIRTRQGGCGLRASGTLVRGQTLRREGLLPE
eukprot:862978-Prymnesium_polylepis.1